MRGVIYKYTSPSGKSYIGQTVREDQRKKEHYYLAYCYENSKFDTKFYKAIRKYG
jgi:hypothetical protein